MHPPLHRNTRAATLLQSAPHCLRQVISIVEGVEKVSKRLLARDAEKNDRGECPTNDDRTTRKGKKTPENSTKIMFWSYSTDSFYGSRNIRDELWCNGCDIGRDRVRRLMRRMDIETLRRHNSFDKKTPTMVYFNVLLRKQAAA